MSEEVISFHAEMNKRNAITIPIADVKALGLVPGDLLRVKIEVIEKHDEP